MGTQCLGGTQDLKEVKAGPDRCRGYRKVSSFPAGDRKDSRRREENDISGADRNRAHNLSTRTSSFPATGFSTPSDSSLPCMEFSCTTFNILAPIFKRVGEEDCLESQVHNDWFNRNVDIIKMLMRKPSSIICLQEIWLGNEELVHLYEGRLGCEKYLTFKLARTNDKGDGLLTAIKSDQFTVLNYKELQFHDRGDRVAQFFHLRLAVPSYKGNQVAGQQLLLVNTHLLFPHNFSYCLVRLWQVYKIIECLEHFKVEHSLASVPVILCGDWNGSKRGYVYKFLSSQGFVSCYDGAHKNDAQQWVSHQNHRANICGVDFIFLRNSNKHQQSLSSSWKEAVLDIIMAMLCEAGVPQKNLPPMDMLDPFQPKKNRDKLSLMDFQKGLHHRGFSRNDLERLSQEKIKELIVSLYEDASNLEDASHLEDKSVELKGTLPFTAGVSDDESVPFLSKCTISGKSATDAPNTSVLKEGGGTLEKTAGLVVQDAFFFPSEVEQGSWPEGFKLSDHAALTAIFKSSMLSE